MLADPEAGKPELDGLEGLIEAKATVLGFVGVFGLGVVEGVVGVGVIVDDGVVERVELVVSVGVLGSELG